MSTKYVKEKKIIVKSVGTINILGGVTGPILKPFIRDTKTIMHLVNTNCDVYEVLNDGTQVKLTMRNFETDNNVSVAKVAPATHKEKVAEVQTTVEEVKDETPATETKSVENKAYEKNNNGKKNK